MYVYKWVIIGLRKSNIKIGDSLGKASVRIDVGEKYILREKLHA